MAVHIELAKQDARLFAIVFKKMCERLDINERVQVINCLHYDKMFEQLYENYVSNSKKCSSCGLIKHISEYYRDLQEKDNYRYECKVCTTNRRKNND